MPHAKEITFGLIALTCFMAILIMYLAISKRRLRKQCNNITEAWNKETNTLGVFRTMVRHITNRDQSATDGLWKMLKNNEGMLNQLGTSDKTDLEVLAQQVLVYWFERFVLYLPTTSGALETYFDYKFFPCFSPLDAINFDAGNETVRAKIMAIFASRLSTCSSPAEIEKIFLEIRERAKKAQMPFFYFRPNAFNNPELLTDEEEWFRILQSHLDTKTKIYLSGCQGEMNRLCLVPKNDLVRIFELCKESHALAYDNLLSFDLKIDLKSQLTDILGHAILAIKQSVPELNSDDAKEYSNLLKMSEDLEKEMQAELAK